MFLPRVMRPLPAASRLTNPAVARLAGATLSLVRGPVGSYVAEWLAAAIQEWDRWQSCVWFRTGGVAPAALADSLVSACRQRWVGDPHAGSSGSGPRPEEVLRDSPAGAILVVELPRWVTPGVARVLYTIRRAAAERGVNLIAVAEGHVPALLLGRPDCVVSTAAFAEPIVVAEDGGLPEGCSQRLSELSGRRAAIRHDVLDAARGWPVEAVTDALGRSGRRRSILDQLTANLLELAGPAQHNALATCLATGYWHPQLATDVVPVSELRPWVVPLEQEWGWLRPIWARSLQRCLSAGTTRRPRSRSHHRVADPPAPAAEPTAPQRGIVEARLLGSLELSIDGVKVDRWTGQRGTSVLRYLLSRRRYSCSRDEILDAFWPDVPPEVARNRLQVAISGLRRALREVTNLSVIEYGDGCYRLSPELHVDVDVERFEERLSAARRAERSGDLDRALIAYREAVELYRGDFAADAPYEQWTLLQRESMRITYIDALDRVSRIQLSVGRIDDCIATGHRMLEVDPCREDAHRLLMRCYTSLGRTYQAIRQYEFCCRVLRETLQTEPAAETTRLYRAIRTGSLRKPASTS